MKERNEYLDIIRGIAVILMVLGHCIQYGNGTEFSQPDVFFNNKAFQIIYSFHMPLFMLISGYLFTYTARKYCKIWDFVKNRILRLLLPIAGWQAITYFQYALKMEKNDGWIREWLISYFKSLPREYWFLWAVFYCSIAVWIGRYVFRNSIIYYLFGFLLTFFVPDIIYNLSYYKFMYPFFVGGYLFAENEEAIKAKLAGIGNGILLISTLAVYGVLFLFWNYDSFIYTSGYTLLGRSDALRQFGIDCYRTVIGFVGSMVIILAVKWIYDFILCKYGDELIVKGLNYVLSHIGKKSLGIYIISGTLVGSLLIDNIEKFSVNYLNNILQMIVILGISYFITYLISKIPFLSCILLGGRADNQHKARNI
ncbi:MAG: acyltransferase [Lachnospiraceae bacterium]|nr:acyltransferase [Lachnospiraceae bacterium]